MANTRPRSVHSDYGYRRVFRGKSEETSLFGSPEPFRERPHSSYSYRGPKLQDMINDKAFYDDSILRSRPGSSLTERDFELAEAEFDLPELPSAHSKAASDVSSRAASRYRIRNRFDEDIEDKLDDKLLAYRKRHFTDMGRQAMLEKNTRLPSYDNDLLQCYQRSFIRQADIVSEPEVPITSNIAHSTMSRKRVTSGQSVWNVFPTVEDLDACYLIEKQFEVAIDPYTEYPLMSDWMGMFHGEDGVFTLNKGMSHMPLTGKCACTNVPRMREGVRMITVYRPPGRIDATFGFHITTMDNGTYVSYIESNSSAVRAGLRYGDQILRIGEVSVSGMLTRHVNELIVGDELVLFVRDRPNEKLYTLLRDSKGVFGFRIRSAQIVEVMPNSSAARNGVPTNHYIVEINGQNVVGWDDCKLRDCMECATDGAVSFVLLNERTYTDLIKDLGASLLASMDHSCDINIEFPEVELPERFDWNPVRVFNTFTEKTTIQN